MIVAKTSQYFVLATYLDGMILGVTVEAVEKLGIEQFVIHLCLLFSAAFLRAKGK